MHTLMLISLIIGFYVFLRVVLPLRVRWWWKLVLGVGIGVAAMCFEGLKLLGGGRIFAPSLPAGVILGYTWLYLLLMVFFVFVLVAQVVRVCMVVWPRWRSMDKAGRQWWFNRVHMVLLGVAMVSGSVGMYCALCQPRVQYVAIPSDTELRIAMLSDLHADAVKGEEFFDRIVEQTNALNPDVVVITGDFVDGSVRERGKNLLPLRGLKARLGVYGVPGNHDYFSGYEEWLPFLSYLGVRMLNNECVLLGEPGVVLAGVTDPSARLFGKEGPNVGKALAGAPEGRQVILLAHQPKVALQAKELVDVQLSGHTHGGQVLGLTLLTGAYNNGWYSGAYRVGERMLLYVSNGTSLWCGMPMRFGVPSEITLITLTAAPQQSAGQ